MSDFSQIVPVKAIFSELGIDASSPNFEVAYSSIVADPALVPQRRELETAIFDYFSSLELPPRTTIFDRLLLSLRSKDVIATFNWDPFLLQAARRNRPLDGNSPSITFLHGNVLSGYCERDQNHGVRNGSCTRCGEPFVDVPLLYPVADKNYESHPAIRDSWRFLKWALSEAFMVTVFGYSAPSSDRSAISVLKGAWGHRTLEQFEIIDIADEQTLISSWSGFITSDHYEIHETFEQSWLAKHPRRAGEAYWNQYMEARFISDNPITVTDDLEDLWAWFQPLIEAEVP